MAKITNWNDLTADEQNAVLERANIGHGIIIDTSDSWELTFGTKLVKVGLDDFDPTYLSKSGEYDTDIFETKAESSLRNYGIKKGSVNAGVSGVIKGVSLGASGSANYSREKEETLDSTETRYYLYSEYLIEKIRLDLNKEMPPLASGFAKKLEKVTAGTDSSVQKLTEVYKVLNEMGWYVAKSLTLGGKLTMKETIVTQKTTKTSKIVTEFGGEFKANVGVPKVFDANAGGSYSQKDEKEQSNSLYSSETGKTLDVVGGSPKGLADNSLAPWIMSLDDSGTWKIIGLELIPTLAFLDQELLNSIKEHYNKWGSYETAKRAAMIDAFQYMGEVGINTGEADDW
jgi:hypothetical protein